MALSDYYKLRFMQQYEGEPFENVFTFQKTGSATNAQQLATEFNTTMIPLWREIQTNSVAYTGIDVVNLGDPSDFYFLDPDEVGIHASDTLPLFVAVNFTYKVNTRAVRPGTKRIGGLPEAAMVNGTLTGSQWITAAEDIRDQLLLGFPIGGAPGWLPVVIKRVKYVPDEDKPTQFAYRLPKAGDPLVVAGVVQVLVNTKASHQVSRGN